MRMMRSPGSTGPMRIRLKRGTKTGVILHTGEADNCKETEKSKPVDACTPAVTQDTFDSMIHQRERDLAGEKEAFE